MSLSSDIPSLHSAEAHLRMLVNEFYTDNENIEKMPVPSLERRIIRAPLPIPDELFGYALHNLPPIDSKPDIVKSISYRVATLQQITPEQEPQIMRALQESSQDLTGLPLVSSLALVKVIEYATRNATTKPPTVRAAGRVIAQAHFQITRDIGMGSDAEYRVYGRIVRQVTPQHGTPEPIEEFSGGTVCLNDQLVPVNQYLIDALVSANSKQIDALTPENFT